MMQRVTADVGANDQLLYFTSPSLTEGGETLVFISDRGGAVNLWSRDLATGEERQMSRNTGGLLRSYVYLNDTPYEHPQIDFNPTDDWAHFTRYATGKCAV